MLMRSSGVSPKASSSAFARLGRANLKDPKGSYGNANAGTDITFYERSSVVSSLTIRESYIGYREFGIYYGEQLML